MLLVVLVCARARSKKRTYLLTYLMPPVRRQDERVARMQRDDEGLRLGEERVARKVGVRHVDQREIVELAARQRLLGTWAANGVWSEAATRRK